MQVNWARGGVLATGQNAIMGDKRVANLPNADLGRARKIWVQIPASDESPAYVGPIRVAAGGRKLYDALSASGRVATQSILFDTGSDHIRAESTPTLKEITTMLTEHPDLSLTIEGHTDDVGDAEANVALSAKRAEAVRAYLVGKGIGGDRLTTKGLGASRPAASTGSTATTRR